MGRGGVWHAIVPKNAKIGPEVDFEYLLKMGPLGQGAKTHLRFFTEIYNTSIETHSGGGPRSIMHS